MRYLTKEAASNETAFLCKNAKKCKIICTYQKKAVILQSILGSSPIKAIFKIVNAAKSLSMDTAWLLSFNF